MAQTHKEKFIAKGRELISLLRGIVGQHPSDVTALSGGVDSSMLLALSPQQSVTVQIDGRGSDLENARKTAEYLGVPWSGVEVCSAEAIDILEKLVVLSRTYDLALLNDIAILRSLQFTMEQGGSVLRTGDTADMMFCGYQFMWSSDWRDRLKAEYPYMQPSVVSLAHGLGIDADTPYYCKEILDFVLSLDDEMQYGEMDFGIPGDVMVQRMIEQGMEGYTETIAEHFYKTMALTKNVWGKLILRSVAESVLPYDIAWRQKTDLQFGSGGDDLQCKLAKEITMQEQRDFEKEGFVLFNATHALLLKIFLDNGLEFPEPEHNQYACKSCGSGVDNCRKHCRTCGLYPAK